MASKSRGNFHAFGGFRIRYFRLVVSTSADSSSLRLTVLDFARRMHAV